ncbi:hypothetical protein [Lentzea sp. NPDC004782]|uniref:hypothetical protein n=1 Tax=Lentzea sp. NPDC004782 TaxID=3154458 RepID=UPI0033AA0F7A
MFRTGLLVLGLLSVTDLLLPLLTDGQSPPMAIALVSAALGLAGLVLLISAWRGAQRAILPLIVLRAVSAATALPAFVAPDVPAPAIAAAAATVLLTAAGATLVLKGRAAVTR